jgi:non-ribosomal peptide synthetase component F
MIYDPLIFSDVDILMMKNKFSVLQAQLLSKQPLDLASLCRLDRHIPQLVPQIDFEDSEAVSSPCFHSWFEHQASVNPQLLALHSDELKTSMTYHELNEVSNRLAHCKC